MNSTKVLDNKIEEYLPRLNTLQKKTILSVIKTFVTEQQDWWDQISDEQQKLINEALSEAEAGKLTPHDQVMKSYRKWRKKS